MARSLAANNRGETDLVGQDEDVIMATAVSNGGNQSSTLRPPDVPPLALGSVDSGLKQQFSSPRRPENKISPRPPLSPSPRDPLSARAKGQSKADSSAVAGSSPRFGSPKEKRSARKSRKHSSARKDRKSASSPADVVAAMVGNSPVLSSASRQSTYQNPLLRNHSPVRDRRRVAGSAPSHSGALGSQILEADERLPSKMRASLAHMPSSSWGGTKAEEESLALVQQLFGGMHGGQTAGGVPVAVPTDFGSINHSYNMNSPMSPNGSYLATPRSGTPLVPRRLYRSSQGEESYSYRDGGRRSSSYSSCGHHRTPSFRTGHPDPSHSGALCSARTLSSTATHIPTNRRGSHLTSTQLSLDESWEVGNLPMASPILAASPSPLPHTRSGRTTTGSSQMNLPTELLESQAVMDYESEEDSTCGRVDELCDKANTLLNEMRGLMTNGRQASGDPHAFVDSAATTAAPSLEDLRQKQRSGWITEASPPLPSELPATTLFSPASPSSSRRLAGEAAGGADGRQARNEAAPASMDDTAVRELQERIARLENSLKSGTQQQQCEQRHTARIAAEDESSSEVDRMQRRIAELEAELEANRRPSQEPAVATMQQRLLAAAAPTATMAAPPRPWQPPLLPQTSSTGCLISTAAPGVQASPSLSSYSGGTPRPAAPEMTSWLDDGGIRLATSASSAALQQQPPSAQSSFVAPPVKIAPLSSVASCTSLASNGGGGTPASRAASPQQSMRFLAGGVSFAAMSNTPTPCRSRGPGPVQHSMGAAASTPRSESPAQLRHPGMQPQVCQTMPGMPLPPASQPQQPQLQPTRSASSLQNSSFVAAAPPPMKMVAPVSARATIGTPPTQTRALSGLNSAPPLRPVLSSARSCRHPSPNATAPWQFSPGHW